MNKSELIKLKSNVSVTSLEYINSGWDSSVYLLNNEQIVKFPNGDEVNPKLLVESKILDLLSKKGIVTVPKVIFTEPTGEFLVISKINGLPLSKISNQNEINDVLTDITDVIFKLSEVNNDELNKLNIPLGQNLEERFNSLLSNTKILEQYLSSKLISLVIKYLQQASNYIQHINLFCHDDISLEHIYVQDYEITGVIDWSDVKLSDPAYEFGRLLRETLQYGSIMAKLKKYNVDQDFLNRLKIYAILSSAENIVEGHLSNNREYARKFAKKIADLSKVL